MADRLAAPAEDRASSSATPSRNEDQHRAASKAAEVEPGCGRQCAPLWAAAAHNYPPVAAGEERAGLGFCPCCLDEEAEHPEPLSAKNLQYLWTAGCSWDQRP